MLVFSYFLIKFCSRVSHTNSNISLGGFFGSTQVFSQTNFICHLSKYSPNTSFISLLEYISGLFDIFALVINIGPFSFNNLSCVLLFATLKANFS